MAAAIWHQTTCRGICGSHWRRHRCIASRSADAGVRRGATGKQDMAQETDTKFPSAMTTANHPGNQCCPDLRGCPVTVPVRGQITRLLLERLRPRDASGDQVLRPSLVNCHRFTAEALQLGVRLQGLRQVKAELLGCDQGQPRWLQQRRRLREAPANSDGLAWQPLRGVGCHLQWQ